MQVINFKFRPLYVCGKNLDTNQLLRWVEVRAGLEPWDKEQTPCSSQNKKMIPCS
jgi:hypothetical protein